MSSHSSNPLSVDLDQPDSNTRLADEESELEPKKKISRCIVKGPKKWTPLDDMTLKDGIQGSSNFQKLARSLRFSVRFTAYELEQRWRLLLYNREVSEASTLAMSKLPYNSKRATWSDKEEEIIIREVGEGFMGFQALLDTYRPFFHPIRSARSIEAHCLKKKLGRLNEVGGGGGGGTSGLKHPIDDNSLPPFFLHHQPPSIPLMPQEDNMKNFDITTHPGCLAGLFGVRTTYPIGTSGVLIGRCGLGPEGVNLANEAGNAAKISRRQAIISFDEASRQFTLKNIGRAHVVVNGIQLEKDAAIVLTPKATLSFNEFEFLFQILKKDNL